MTTGATTSHLSKRAGPPVRIPGRVRKPPDGSGCHETAKLGELQRRVEKINGYTVNSQTARHLVGLTRQGRRFESVNADRNPLVRHQLPRQDVSAAPQAPRRFVGSSATVGCHLRQDATSS